MGFQLEMALRIMGLRICASDCHTQTARDMTTL